MTGPKIINCTGDKFGKLTLIEYLGKSKWVCRCDCGTERIALISLMKSGKSVECKHCIEITNRDRKREDFTGRKVGDFLVLKYLNNLKYEVICDNKHQSILSSQVLKRNSNVECRQCKIDKEKTNMIGKRIGKWTVIKLSDKKQYHSLFWECQCDCGYVGIIRTGPLRNGRTSACIKCKSKFSNGESAFNKVYYYYRHGAKKRNLTWELTLQQFKEITQSNCFYTGLPPSSIAKNKGGEYIYNGIDRIDNDKGYTIDNCVPCNGIINRMKSALSYSEFVSLCSLVAKTIGEKNINGIIKNKLKAV